MPILGVVASGISGRLSSFQSIATGIVDASGASSITFSSIPQTFSHLQLRCYNKAVGSAGLLITFNGSTSGYINTWTEGNGDGTAVVSSRETGNSGIVIYAAITANTPASYFAHSVMDIPNYANTGITKTLRALNGFDHNSASPKGYLDLDGGFWNNTDAINSITVAATANNFAQNTQIALYGIRQVIVGVTYTNSSALTYEPIQSFTLANSSTATFNFTSIPSTYTDLVLVMTGAATVGNNAIFININADTNVNNYGFTEMAGSGSTTSSQRRIQNTGWVFWQGMSTSYDNVVKIELNNYAKTVGYKTAMLINNSAQGHTEQLIGSWANTSAINRIEIFTTNGAFYIGTMATLYGIKAA